MSGQEAVNAMRARRGTLRPRRTVRGLDLILGVLAVLSLGCCTFFAYGAFTTAPPVGGPSPRPLASANLASEVWTEQDTARCESAARHAARTPDPRAAQFASSGFRSVTDGGYARLATRMRCLARTKVSRLCDPAQKALFVAAMNDYTTRFDVIVMGLRAQSGIVGAAGDLMGGEPAAGSAILDIHTEATLDYMRVYHRDLAASLKELARAGLLSTGDFDGGLFGVSGTITSILDGITPSYRLCQ